METYKGEKLWNDKDPSPLVVQIAGLLSSGTVLDLGAGNGRNAFYLANQGFNVVAVDVDEERIEELKRKSDLESKKVVVVESDINAFHPTQQFDVVLCTMVLHFLSPDNVKSMIEKMKEWTKKGGYNVVTAYSDKNESGKRPYLFGRNELRDYYKGWNVLSYEEKPTPWFLKPGEDTVRRNQAVYLFARKEN